MIDPLEGVGSMKYGLKTKQNKRIMQQYVIKVNHVLDSLV